MRSSSDKPVITPSELISLRKLGLSYKQIGKKLGIDSHKEEVIQIYKSLGINIETMDAKAKVSPPTALWFLFDSEREIIKSDLLPSPMDIKELYPQNRITSRLGGNAGFMLNAYMKVSEIIGEEILSTYEGAGTTTSLGSIKKWDGGGVGIELIRKVFDIQKSVARAAFQLSDYFDVEEIGNCMCSGMKSVRFGWKTTPIPHPSFFWGCSRYIPIESGRHDKGIPVRMTFWKVIGDDIKISRVTDKDIKSLQQKTSSAIDFWEGQEETESDEELFKQALLLYGGPAEIKIFKSGKEVVAVLKSLCKDLKYLIDQRDGESRPSRTDDSSSDD